MWDESEKLLLRGACFSGAKVAITFPNLRAFLMVTDKAAWIIWGYAAAIRENRADIFEDEIIKARYLAAVARHPWGLLELGTAMLPRTRQGQPGPGTA